MLRVPFKVEGRNITVHSTASTIERAEANVSNLYPGMSIHPVFPLEESFFAGDGVPESIEEV